MNRTRLQDDGHPEMNGHWHSKPPAENGDQCMHKVRMQICVAVLVSTSAACAVKIILSVKERLHTLLLVVWQQQQLHMPVNGGGDALEHASQGLPGLLR